MNQESNPCPIEGMLMTRPEVVNTSAHALMEQYATQLLLLLCRRSNLGNNKSSKGHA